MDKINMRDAAGVGDELQQLTREGVSRRNLLRAMAAGGLLSMTGAALMAASGSAFAQEKPKKGGKIRVATQASPPLIRLIPQRARLARTMFARLCSIAA